MWSSGPGTGVEEEEAVTQFTEYAPGTPSWVDLSSPDIEASKDFYTSLFGWDVEDMGPDAGGYCMLKLRGQYVAGLGPLQGEGQPPAWGTYVSVADADATIAAVKKAGGTVLVEPMDVFEAGRMAVFADPTGAVLSIWQPGNHKGSQLANEPGAFSWNELNTRDPAAAKAFYSAVFGWQPEDHAQGPSTYTEWKLDGRSIGGMMDMNPNVPASVPPHWLVYFNVEDTDAAVAAIKGKGGTILVGPFDIPQGRFAVAADPQGAVFAVIAMSQG
jgi:predicted enzyme related to lactoylglutathione lyase